MHPRPILKPMIKDSRTNSNTIVNGQKWCGGPAHEPGWVNISEFVLYRNKCRGNRVFYKGWCKECSNFYARITRKNNLKKIPLDKCYWLFIRVIRSYGTMDAAAKACQMNRSNLYKIKNKRYNNVKKTTVANAIKALRDFTQQSQAR